MPDIVQRFPGPGWGGGLNAFLDAYERAQDRTMAQRSAMGLEQLRGLQFEGARRGLDRESALDLLRQKIVEQAEQEIPLAAPRSVAVAPPPPESFAGTGAPEGFGGPPALPREEIIPGQTMQGRTMSNLLASPSLDPKLRGLLLTEPGQQAARAAGVLTEEEVRRRRAEAEAEQEARAFAHEGRAASEAGDSFLFASKLAAYYQRVGRVLAATDPQGSREARRQSDTWSFAALEFQKDSRERALADEDTKAHGALLRKLSAPGGATAENAFAVLSYRAKAKSWQDYTRQFVQQALSHALPQIVASPYAPLLTTWSQALLHSRDPQAAEAEAVKAHPDLAARALADPGKMGEWARKVFGLEGAKMSDVEVASRAVAEKRADGSPGIARNAAGHWAAVANWLRKIRERPESPGVQTRFEEGQLARSLSEARLAVDAAERQLREAEKARPRKSAPNYATYDRDVLEPIRTRLERARTRHEALQDASDEQRTGKPGAPPPPTPRVAPPAAADPKMPLSPPAVQTPETIRAEVERLRRAHAPRVPTAAELAAMMGQRGWNVAP